ncbi:MAG: hypothetical protein ACRD2Z_13840 [Thermoanaerobaculia bacterium]
MNARVVVAGVLAGIVVFVWGAISHMVLPLGEVGVGPLPAQETVLDVLADHVDERRIYIYPWFEDEARQQQAWADYPHGILALSPPTGPFSFGRALVMEGASNIVGGILAAFLFVAMGPAVAGWGRRVIFGAVLGCFATVAIDLSYWNWYGFPTEYLAAQLVDSIIAWSLAALVIGWWLGRGARTP